MLAYAYILGKRVIVCGCGVLLIDWFENQDPRGFNRSDLLQEAFLVLVLVLGPLFSPEPPE